MVRNLMRNREQVERDEYEADEQHEAEAKATAENSKLEELRKKAASIGLNMPGEENKDSNKEIVIMTPEQVIMNNLQALQTSQQLIYSKMIEGFKKIGINLD